ADSTGPLQHTAVHRPAITRRVLPVALMRAIRFSSSQPFEVVRSTMSASGKASVISSNSGPAKVSLEIVVITVGTLKPLAVFARMAVLVRRFVTSMDLVLNAISD